MSVFQRLFSLSKQKTSSACLGQSIVSSHGVLVCWQFKKLFLLRNNFFIWKVDEHFYYVLLILSSIVSWNAIGQFQKFINIRSEHLQQCQQVMDKNSVKGIIFILKLLLLKSKTTELKKTFKIGASTVSLYKLERYDDQKKSKLHMYRKTGFLSISIRCSNKFHITKKGC